MDLAFPRTTKFDHLRPGQPGTHHLTYFLGATSDLQKSAFLFVRDGKVLYIQFETFYRRDDSMRLGERPTVEFLEMWNKLNAFLPTLQTLLNTISFDHGDWANLYRVGENNYRLTYGRKPAIAGVRTWAPLIDEKDVEIHSWSMRNRGIWNGIQVDLLESFLPAVPGDTHDEIDTLNEAHYRMHGWGLTDMAFRMFGHLIRDGIKVGLVLEVPYGRLIEYEDRAAVYAAMTRLQQHNLIFTGLIHKEIWITDDGIKFDQAITAIRYVADKDQLEREAEEWHWSELKRLFDDLKAKGRNDVLAVRSVSTRPILVPYLPEPGRPLPDLPYFSFLAAAFSVYVENSLEHPAWLLEMGHRLEVGRKSKVKRSSPLAPPIPSYRQERRPTVAHHQIDEPLPISSRHTSRIRLQPIPTKQPYVYYRGTPSTPSSLRDDITFLSDAASDRTLSTLTSPDLVRPSLPYKRLTSKSYARHDDTVHSGSLSDATLSTLTSPALMKLPLPHHSQTLESPIRDDLELSDGASDITLCD